MNAKTITFFNNKGGVGKTSLIYHVAWMLAELNHDVLAVDLDPQANLTAAFLTEDVLERLWKETEPPKADTMYECVSPLMKVGDIQSPTVRKIADHLYLLPGDLALSSFEDLLSNEWPNCFASDLRSQYRAFRVATAFWQVIRTGLSQRQADIVLIDVGPSLGAINRSALIATDCVVVPLGADLFSRQGLRNLGPTLRRWRRDWQTRLEQCDSPDFALPDGRMKPIGYLVQQHGVRLSRPVKAYDRWANQMPAEYARHVMDETTTTAATPADDEHCIATIKRYRSLVPLGRDARKPIFLLRPADGAIGSHATAANQAYDDFRALTNALLLRSDLGRDPGEPRGDMT